ncbi:NAD-dependent succinate-semialdehyde dehydrogenase [Parendozoicomonas haliclonae]|uniref:Succinate-semialdehyde dehydrogenase [NADP(+)] 1 n=1 Tax=Parendozoicomonas haliclonae TaxID=1960125 RepID=A0A1X7ARI9_9GAMM|nr:NAD-dependent succinate-semialdehyde dehydrogenase [Parendozoicomonas haliclonae]SMA50708.1 Succinate-semialdehyde dehydrogenase [NADP(+)] 1 [Parendozoicomonas haliclonae]
MSYASTNPFTNEVVERIPESTDAEVSQALEAAHEAFLAWRETSFAERTAVLKTAADLARQRADDLARLMTLEMGKLFTEAKGEVELMANIFDYYAELAEHLLAPESLKAKNPLVGDVTLVHEPLGVILAIEPWNFPFYQAVRIAAPQLAAGNTLLLKHASNVPQCAAAFEKLLHDAGLPRGGFINLYPSRSQIETIINDSRVQGVALTGSEGAGSVVAAQAGRAMKKSTLELGGSDALIVLPDADMEETVKWALFGRFFNCGQCCVASKRMIIADELYDTFIDRYAEAINQLKPGDPMNSGTTLSPLSSQRAADDLKEQVKLATANGANVQELGVKIPEQGAFVQPMLLTNVTKDSPVYYQELFGPVTMLFRAKDADHALTIANDSPYGLGGSVFGTDKAKTLDVAKRLSTGMVFINHPTLVEPDLPFGGIRHSGYGRELIGLGIKEFVNHKLINGKL